MMRFFGLSTLLLAILTPAIHGQEDKGQISIQPTQFSVYRARDPKDFQSYGRDQRTETEFVLSAPGRQILRIDSTAKVKVFEDDKGNSLIDPKAFPPTAFNSSFFGLKNGALLVVGVSSYSRIPGAGAAKVFLKGELVLVHGLEVVTTPKVKIDFTTTGETKVGDLVLRVDVKKRGTSGEPYFEVVGPARAIKSVAVVGDNGKATPTTASGTIDTAPGPRTHRLYALGAITHADVVITYFAKEEILSVPIDLTFSAGL